VGSDLAVKFWGTRGHVSSPRRETATYGGNTTSIQILHQDLLLVVDTGFGVSNLGEELMNKIINDKKSLEIHILFTHFHWDHVQGLPFFHPIYFPSTTLHLYSPWPTNVTEQALDVLFDGSYSPFSGIRSMPSKIEIHTIEKELNLGHLNITHAPCHHIANNQKGKTGSFSYKIKNNLSSLVIATDHEATPSSANSNLIEFASDCSLLIHDAQYSQDEYKSKNNWGHSSFESALENANLIKAKKTLLTHHDPKRDDGEITTHFVRLKKMYTNLDFEFAREGVLYTVEES